MEKFIYSLGIIFIGFVLGYAIQFLTQRNIIRLSIEIDTLRRILQKVAFLFLDPIIYIGAIWSVNFDKLKYITLPFLGIIAIILGGAFALFFAKVLKMSRKQTGAYIVSGGFTNVGSIGGLICYSFLGEAGFALASIYKLFETFTYYTFGFPIAKSFGKDMVETKGISERARKAILDPFVLVAIVSMLAGLILNISGVERPNWYSLVNSLFIPTASILLLSSIGMAMQINQASKYIIEGSLIAVIKFAIVPVIMTTMAYLIGFGKIDQGVPLKVVLILSSMPVGFTALVPPTLYELDIDLANASWIVTNALLFFVVPLLQHLTMLF